MTLDDYQAAAVRTVNPALGADDRLLDAASGLAEESGEILAHVRKNRFQQKPIDRDEVVLELGDALWCLATIASSLGFSLGEVADRNVEKLRQRHPDGFTGQGGHL
jgi:NTP pyrophosphatase (non-canonical NTP hydrolase)